VYTTHSFIHSLCKDILSVSMPTDHHVEEGWALESSDVKLADDPFARGSFGLVYKGSYFGTPVCVKVVPMDHHNPDDIKQVQREIAMLKALNHPYLVQFFGLFSLHNEMYIVTEYIPGGTVRSNIQKDKGDISWAARVKMANDVASAISFLHSRNIIHRDIKSENLLLTETWDVKLCDFGLSRSVAEPKKKQRMTLCGTDDFMAPEVTLGMDYDEACDIFSYGMFLCELILRDKIEDALPRGPETFFGLDIDKFLLLVPQDTPQELVNLVLKCCDYEPTKRPDAKEVLQSLSPIMEHYYPKGLSPSNSFRPKLLRKLRMLTLNTDKSGKKVSKVRMARSKTQ
jgi:serine/threonine protein kinase